MVAVMRALQLAMARKECKTVPLQGSSRWPCQYNLRDTDIEWPTNWNTASAAQDHTQTDTQIPMSPTTFRGQDTPLKSGVSVQGSGKNYVEQPQQPESLHTAHHPLCRDSGGQQKPFQTGKSSQARCGSTPQDLTANCFYQIQALVRTLSLLSLSKLQPSQSSTSTNKLQKWTVHHSCKWSWTVRKEGIYNLCFITRK